MNKLRIYFRILGFESFTKEVSSPEEAYSAINFIADFINFYISKGALPDHCNVAGLEEWDDEVGDWIDWYDDYGLDLFEHMEEAENEQR